MAEVNGEFPTVIGADAKFKGELTFEKGVRVEGMFDGHIHSKGTLHVAEGARVSADVQAANVRIEGECKGNVLATEKLHLLATAKMEGDLRANRLEIADGAMFSGHVVTGQQATEAAFKRPSPAQPAAAPAQVREQPRPAQPQQPQGAPVPRPPEMRIAAHHPG